MRVEWPFVVVCAGLALLPMVAQAKGPRRTVDFGQEESTEASQAQDRIDRRVPSITRLKDLLAKGASGVHKPEMLLRLAELLYSNGRDYRLMEEEAFNVAYGTCFDADGCDESAIKADYLRSTEVWTKASNLYQIVLTSFPAYAKADEAGFYLAAVQSDLGDPGAAVQTRLGLVRTYPDSAFTPDTYILLGEQFFDDNEAFKALRAYQRATQYPEHDKYSYALYMLAWSQYNVGDIDAGIDTLKRVVGLARTTGDPLALEQDAVRDLVMFFTDNNDVDGAVAFFIRIGRKDLIPAILERGAGLLADHGQYADAVLLYRRLILEDPAAERAVDHHREIVKVYRRLDDHERYVAELDRFVADYGPGSAWRTGKEADLLAEADGQIERAIRDGAWSYHERSRKLTQSGREAGPFRAHAQHLYAGWLSTYSDGIHQYEVRHAYAELLYDLALYQEAYDQFRQLVSIDPAGKYSEESARNAIFAADELGDLERYVDAAEQYAIHFPATKDTGNILYRSGHMLYEAGQYPRAADLFERVIRINPRTREAELAAELMMDVFVLQESWEELERRSRFYFEMDGLGSRKFKDAAFAVYQNARLKRIETELSDHGAAADAFVAWVEEFPKAEKAAMALNNAAVYYDELERFDDALAVRHILVEDPRFGAQTPYYFDHLAALCFAYEQIADFRTAASWYERLVGEFAGAPGRQEAVADALHISAVFRDALGDWKASVALYQRFIDAYPADERIVDMRLTVGRIYEDQGKWERAAAVFEDFYVANNDLSSEYLFFARIHHGRDLEQQGKISEAAEVYAKTAELYRVHLASGGSHGAHTEFAAESMYRLAREAYDVYDAIALVGIEASMSKAEQDKLLNGLILDKMRGLSKLEKTYGEIVATGAGEWGIAAIVQMGQAHEEMSRSLVDSDRPTYLTEPQLVEYEDFLDQLIFTQLEKSKHAYALAVNKSTELQLYNESSHIALERLDYLGAEDAPTVPEMLSADPYLSRTTAFFDYEQNL